MRKITYHKLVRDRIPEIIEASGKICVSSPLSDSDYLRMLDAKLEEELAEFRRSRDMEELADLMEVIYATAEAHGCSPEQLEAIRRKKAAERGAFRKKILLTEVIEKEPFI